MARPPLALVIAPAITLALLAALAAVAAAARRDWTGSAACGACHPAQLAAWQATPHASTKRRLPAAPPGRCLACHGTGEAPAGPAIAAEVGCEACHGAGAAYAEDDLMRSPQVARALGLADLSTPAARAAVCAPCHARPTRSATFDPAVPAHPAVPAPPAPVPPAPVSPAPVPPAPAPTSRTAPGGRS